MLRTLLSTEGPRLHVVGADDPIRPVPLSFRASARTGVGIRFPLPPSASEVAARSAGGGNDIARQFLSPNRLPDTPPPGALQRGAAALTGRRTPRAFVPLRSTAGRRPLRAVQRTCPIGRLALRPPFIPASVSSRAAEQSILSRDGATGIPNCTFPDTTKPRDFRRGVSCWRYLSSQAVSSQVLSAEASLTSVFGMGTGGPSP